MEHDVLQAPRSPPHAVWRVAAPFIPTGTKDMSMRESLHDEWDLLDEAENETRQVASEMEFDSDVDRRRFVFLSLAAAAATTFGYGAKALAQAEAGGRGAAQPPAAP